MTQQPIDEATIRAAEREAKAEAQPEPEPAGPGPEQPSEGDGEDPGKIVFRLDVRDTGDGFNSRLQVGGVGLVGELQVLLIAQVEMGKYSDVVYHKIQLADQEAKAAEQAGDFLGAIAREMLQAIKARSAAQEQAGQQQGTDTGVQQEGNDARPADV